MSVKNAEKILEALREGPKTAKELSYECHIPLSGVYGGIYRILHRMHQEGLVELRNGDTPYLWGLVEDDA